MGLEQPGHKVHEVPREMQVKRALGCSHVKVELCRELFIPASGHFVHKFYTRTKDSLGPRYVALGGIRVSR